MMKTLFDALTALATAAAQPAALSTPAIPATSSSSSSTLKQTKKTRSSAGSAATTTKDQAQTLGSSQNVLAQNVLAKLTAVATSFNLLSQTDDEAPTTDSDGIG
jgi:hypothetical protein